VRRSQHINGMGFVAQVDGVAHAGVIVGDSGVWSLTPPAGRSPSLMVTALEAGLPQLRAVDPELLAALVARGWLATVDRAAERVSVSGPGAPGFVQDLELRLPDGGLDAVAGSGRLLLLVTSYVGTEPVVDVGGYLADLARRGLLLGAPVRAVEPGQPGVDEPDQGTEPAGTELDTVIVTHDGVGFFMELAELVHDGIVSLAEAKLRVTAFADQRLPHSAAPLLTDDEAAALLDPRLLVVEQQRYVYFYARLITEVADARGGPEACPFWLPAVRLTAEAGTATLSANGERAVFDEVAALLDRTITVLSAGSTPEARSEALVSAARLRIALVEPEGLVGDRYAADKLLTYREALRCWRTRRERLAHPKRRPLRPDDVKRELQVAGELAHEALDGATGTLRARALISIIQAAMLREPAAESDAEAMAYAVDAYECLHHTSDPVSWLYLLRIVARFAPGEARQQAEVVFSLPFDTFAERYGEAAARSSIGQGIELALALPDRDLLAHVLDWGSPLSEPVSGPHVRQLWEARLHCLAGDPTACPPQRPDLAKTLRQYELRARRERWTAEQRAAAWLHAAAHARAGRAWPAATREGAAVRRVLAKHRPAQGRPALPGRGDGDADGAAAVPGRAPRLRRDGVRGDRHVPARRHLPGPAAGPPAHAGRRPAAPHHRHRGCGRAERVWRPRPQRRNRPP
jgi:hypothetical protein